MTETQIREPEVRVSKVATREELLDFLKPATKEMIVVNQAGKSITLTIKQISSAEQGSIRSGSMRGAVIDTELFNALSLKHGVVAPKMELADVEAFKGAICGYADHVVKEIWKFSGVLKEEEAKNG